MLWLRYLGISLLKWFGIFTVNLIFVSYVAPSFLKGYLLSLPIWALVFLVSYWFAFWAMHLKLPGKREVTGLIIIWMVSTICLEVFYEIMAVGRPIFILHSPDLYVQYLLEIAAILLAARMLRKRKMRAASGEGMAY